MCSACYVECDSGDVAVVRIGEEKDGAGDFVGFGESAHGQLRGSLGTVGGRVGA